MVWNNLSIGRKLAVGFGSVLFLLTLISAYSYYNFDKVDHLAHETEETSESNIFILMKTIDHLGWIAKLNSLVFDERVASIKIQTDDHKCGFGSWLYSESTKDLSSENKVLGALIDSVKEPHKKLHDSAIKVIDTYVHFDRELDGELASRWIEHLSWMKSLSHSILTGEKFNGSLNPKQCNFGKWYYSYQGDNSEFIELLKGWEQPHIRLHESAQKIVKVIDGNFSEEAIEIFEQETSPALEELAQQYEITMDWIDSLVAKQIAAKDIFQNESLPALAQTRSLLDQIREYYQAEFQRAETEMSDGIDTAILFNLIMAVAAVLIGIVTATLIARSISRPIAKGVKFAKTVSEGDLLQKLDINQKDEVGVLAESLNTMVDKLRSMFEDINQGVSTLTSSSTELSAVSEQMAASAEQTAGKSNQVAAAAEEMSANMNSVAAASEQASTNIQMVATSSEQMSETIIEIASNAEKGHQITNEAVQQAQSVSEKVRELGNAANEIGKVTETINEISDQTNLLALNATIEAARAGEAGKGFAVVANEIKELAKQTAVATQEIREKIEDIQATTKGTVTEVRQIEKIINEINEISSNIASAVEEQTVSTREIAGSINQAAAGIQDVNENVAQSSTVSGEIAQDVTEVNQAATEMEDGSRQVNSSAVELSQLAEQLNELIKQFKV